MDDKDRKRALAELAAHDAAMGLQPGEWKREDEVEEATWEVRSQVSGVGWLFISAGAMLLMFGLGAWLLEWEDWPWWFEGVMVGVGAACVAAGVQAHEPAT